MRIMLILRIQKLGLHIARVFIILATLFHGGLVAADELDDAQSAAKDFLEKVETGQLSTAWDVDVSEWFKQRMTRDAFLANMTMVRAQLGGVGTNRRIIQRNIANVPGGDSPSRVFSFTFATTYPGAKVYEVVVLTAEGASYKMTGINFVPNPN